MNLPELPYYKLCILIPCYNNFEGLIKSIQSIDYLPGSYIIIVVDDGSLMPVAIERMNGHFHTLPNVKIIRLLQNHGITKALNTGLEFIYANYAVQFIARLDCGDTCSPQRFYNQVAFFEKYPDVHLTGTWCYFKDTRSGKGYKYITPTHHDAIEREMYFRNVFIHPTVMWRVSGAGKFKYPEQYPCAEDYGLFYALISKIKSAVIDEYLVTCEINHAGVSISNRSTQLKSRLKVVSFYGGKRVLYLMGALKLGFLMIIPYRIIYSTKKLFYNTT